MKFDEMNVEQLEARQAELAGMDTESATTDELEARADEMEAINIMRKAFNGLKPEEAADKVIDMFSRTRNNREFVEIMKKTKWL